MTDSPSLLGDPPGAQPAAPDSDYIQPNLGHGLRIWWALFWRTTLLSSIAYTGPTIAFHMKLPSYWSYSFNYGAALAMMYFVVRKRFRKFHIRLVAIGDHTQELEPTFWRDFRIWWTFTWRTLVYRVVLSFAMNVPMAFVSGAVAVIYPPLGPAFTVFAGLAVDAGVGLFTIYSSILDEEIADFCVTLAPNSASAILPNTTAPSPAAGISL
jgi:hypothetical protein